MISFRNLFPFFIFLQFTTDIFYSLITKYTENYLIYFPKLFLFFLLFSFFIKNNRLSVRSYFVIFFILTFFLYSIFFNGVLQSSYHLYLFIPLFIPLFYKNLQAIFSYKYFYLYKVLFLFCIIPIYISFLFDYQLDGILYIDNGLFSRISQRQEIVFDFYRHTGFFRTWDLAASYLAIIGFYLIYYEKKIIIKFTYFFLCLIAIFFTTSKSLFIGFFLICCLYVFNNYKVFLFFVFTSLFLLAFFLFYSFFSPDVYENIYGNNPFLSSLELRVYMVWKEIVLNFKFLGNGFGSIGTPTYLADEIVAVDNNYFHFIYIFGIFTIFFIYKFVKNIIFLYKHNKEDQLIAFYGILILLTSLVTDIIQFIPFKLLIGIIFFKIIYRLPRNVKYE